MVPGTPKGDVYSFGIILYEMHTRHGPFGEIGMTPMECLRKVLQPHDFSTPFRFVQKFIFKYSFDEKCFNLKCIQSQLYDCFSSGGQFGNPAKKTVIHKKKTEKQKSFITRQQDPFGHSPADFFFLSPQNLLKISQLTSGTETSLWYSRERLLFVILQ